MKRRPMLVWLTMVSARQPRGLPHTSLNWSCSWSGSVSGRQCYGSGSWSERLQPVGKLAEGFFGNVVVAGHGNAVLDA